MLATSGYVIGLRVVHITAGVAWAGSVFLFVVFVQPSARAIGPAGAPFMRELLGKRRLVRNLLWIAGVAIAGGLLLYWRDWQAAGSFGDWIGTRFGLGLTIGSVAAIVAFLIGLFGTRPNVARLLALGARMAEAGDRPPTDLVQEVQATQSRLVMLARLTLAFIAVAVLAMATARYW